MRRDSTEVYRVLVVGGFLRAGLIFIYYSFLFEWNFGVVSGFRVEKGAEVAFRFFFG